MVHQPGFAPTDMDIAAAIDHAQLTWLSMAHTAPSATIEDLREAWNTIHAHATNLGGSSLDSQRRAIAYYAMFEDSGQNFMFPLVASHGSMWGVSHTRRLQRALMPLGLLSRRGRVQRWMDVLDAIRDINRRVFIEIYTTFYFSRHFGTHPDAVSLVRPELLAIYNRAHHAAKAGEQLPYDIRRQDYFEVFVHEQHDIVDPGIQTAVLGMPRALVWMFGHVRPRFSYFPRGERLLFTDFVAVEQRNREGLRALDFAEEVGPRRVLAALSEYS